MENSLIFSLVSKSWYTGYAKKLPLNLKKARFSIIWCFSITTCSMYSIKVSIENFQLAANHSHKDLSDLVLASEFWRSEKSKKCLEFRFISKFQLKFFANYRFFAHLDPNQFFTTLAEDTVKKKFISKPSPESCHQNSIFKLKLQAWCFLLSSQPTASHV